MNDKIEVSKIIIRIGKKEIELSLEQAKELQAALNNALGNGYTWTVYPYVPYTIGDGTGTITVSSYNTKDLT